VIAHVLESDLPKFRLGCRSRPERQFNLRTIRSPVEVESCLAEIDQLTPFVSQLANDRV